MPDGPLLVVVAHADDEILGCGGTIARFAAEGVLVHVVFMTNGVSARASATDQDIVLRNAARDTALSIVGVASYDAFDFPDNRMDSIAILDIVRPLEHIIQGLRPATVITHHYGDLNVDHRATHDATLTACRPLPGSSVREILACEIPSSTEWASVHRAPFLPSCYINIARYLPLKQKALYAYQTEMRDAPHARSPENIEALAKHRGMCIGVHAAEAFMTLRRIV